MSALIMLFFGGIITALAINEEAPEMLDKFIDEFKGEQTHERR